MFITLYANVEKILSKIILTTKSKLIYTNKIEYYYKWLKQITICTKYKIIQHTTNKG